MSRLMFTVSSVRGVDVQMLGDTTTTWFDSGGIASLLNVTNIRNTISDFGDGDKRVITGAGPKRIMLSFAGVVKYLIMCRRDQDTVRNICAWVLQIEAERTAAVEEEVVTLREQQEKLQDALDKRDVVIQRLSAPTDPDATLHTRLVEAHGNTKLVYIGVIRREADGRALIKVGSSAGIVNRSTSHRNRFGSFFLTNVFPCEDHLGFEKHLHAHSFLNGLRFKDEIVPGVRSTETYLVSDAQLEKIVRIARTNIDGYRGAECRLKQLHTSIAVSALWKDELVAEPVKQTTASTEPVKTVAAPPTDTTASVSVDSGDATEHMPPPAAAAAPEDDRWECATWTSSSAPTGELDLDVHKARYARCRHNMTDRQAGLLAKARSVFATPKPKKFDLVCALALVTGLSAVELLRGRIGERGAYTCNLEDGIVKDPVGFEFETLLPSEVVIHQLRRLHVAMPCDDMTNQQINLRWTTTINSYVRDGWIKDATFKQLLHTYREIITKGRCSDYGVGRKRHVERSSTHATAKKART
jgi:hypothetical protein